MNLPYVFKKCSKCGRYLVANSVNFRKNKQGKYGLYSRCKACEKAYQKEWYNQNKDKIIENSKKHNNKTRREYKKEYNKKYRERNKDKINEYRKNHYKNNKDKYAEYAKKYYENNKDKCLRCCKKYQEEHKEQIQEYSKNYYKENKEQIREQQKDYWSEYYKNNKELLSEQNKEYYQSPRGQVVHFNINNRRRAKEQAQGNGITTEQWLECMSFFDWKCAYSGETLTKKTRSIDHIVPLNKKGQNEIWNLVPMYKSYNSSKNDRDMLSWYKDQEFYSEERLAKIREWQEYAYNKYCLGGIGNEKAK